VVLKYERSFSLTLNIHKLKGMNNGIHKDMAPRVTSVFGTRPRQILVVIQGFGKHCSCHLQGECAEVGRFRKPYIGQVVGGELDLIFMVGGAGCYPMCEFYVDEETR
jgi:hypothetical protein